MLNNLTNFHKIWYEHNATKRPLQVNNFNFLPLIILTWRQCGLLKWEQHSRDLMLGPEILCDNKTSKNIKFSFRKHRLRANFV
jgi:hypothetical protein